MMKPDFMGKLLDGVEVEWKTLGEVVNTITAPAKVKKEVYREKGEIPIIDQGIGFIAGYTDEDIKPVNADEYVVFGDHSEHIKYVDFSFIQGADGLKILKSKFANTKYIYYAFINFYQKELNYKRHWSSAKETLMPIPYTENPEKSLEIQTEIVRILDTFTELTVELTAELTAEITARKKQYTYYRDQLLTFEEGEVEWKALGEVSEIYDGTHQTPKYTSEGVPFVSVQNIRDLYATEKYISIDDFEKYKYKPRKDDIFMTRIGDIGTCAVVKNDKPLAYYVTLTLIRVDKNYIIPEYLINVIESGIGKLELYKRTLVNATPIKINLGEIGKINIPIPPLSEQARIVSILDKFDVLTNSITEDLPREIELRQKQYKYYRNMLLSFPKKEV